MTKHERDEVDEILARMVSVFVIGLMRAGSNGRPDRTFYEQTDQLTGFIMTGDRPLLDK